MRQCCKVMVNNSLIQPRGLSAWHCRPSPAPRRRRRFIRDLRRVGRVPHTPHYFVCLLLRRPLIRTGYRWIGGPPCSGFPLLQGTEPSEALGNELAWDSQPKRQVIPKIRLLSGGGSKRRCPGNLDRTEGTCLESAMDLLIPRPS